MRKISVFRAVFVTLLLLLGATGGVGASPPAQEPSGDVGALAAVGTSFTYQGNLADGGTPATGDYDFEFELYDALSGGSQVGSTVTEADKTVTDGLFSVDLDFGKVFDGTAMWLQINVRPGAGTGAYTALSPRQPLTATPYARYALDGWGGSWSGTGTGLTLSGGTIGLSGSGSTYGVFGQSTSGRGVQGNVTGTAGYGVLGYASSGSGTTTGVWGESVSTDGKGVYGWATAATGTTYGVQGDNGSTSGVGVYGNAYATTGTTYGVYGRSTSSSDDSAGVYGAAGSTSGGNTNGVYGISLGTSGRGVYGTASGSTGRGVYGIASNLSGVNNGVYGWSYSTQGTGVHGSATATSGVTYGIQGINSSTSGTGVYGFANATSGTTKGVSGVSNSDTGYGVYGKNTFGGFAGYFDGPVRVTGGTYPLFVGQRGFLNSTTPTGTSSNNEIRNYSIWAASMIAAPEFNALSDARIKNIQGRSDGAVDIATLSQIEITDYTFKDVIVHGNDPLKKVIGQQVEAVYPQAVNRGIDVVPDIYQKAAIKEGWVEISTDLQKGERVRLIGEKNDGIYEVLDVTPGGFLTDFVADGAAVFVYGREVISLA